MKLGFLGFGSIASAVAQGCVQDGHDIRISARSAARASAFAAAHDNVQIADGQAIVDHAEVLFLGMTAEAARDALTELRFRADQRVVSFMVGIPTEDVAALVAPATFDAVMIPFPSIAEGGSPVLVCPQSDVVSALFGPSNTVIGVDTAAALNDFLAAQAVLSPIVKILSTSADWLADRTGDAHGAEQFLRLLVGGSLMAKPMETRGVLPELLDALNTPGGLNRQFREHMEDAGAYTATQAGLEVLAKRLAED